MSATSTGVRSRCIRNIYLDTCGYKSRKSSGCQRRKHCWYFNTYIVLNPRPAVPVNTIVLFICHICSSSSREISPEMGLLTQQPPGQCDGCSQAAQSPPSRKPSHKAEIPREPQPAGLGTSLPPVRGEAAGLSGGARQAGATTCHCRGAGRPSWGSSPLPPRRRARGRPAAG